MLYRCPDCDNVLTVDYWVSKKHISKKLFCELCGYTGRTKEVRNKKYRRHLRKYGIKRNQNKL